MSQFLSLIIFQSLFSFFIQTNKNNIFKTLNKLNFCIILKQLLYITDNIKTYHRLKNVNNLANEKFQKKKSILRKVFTNRIFQKKIYKGTMIQIQIILVNSFNNKHSVSPFYCFIIPRNLQLKNPENVQHNMDIFFILWLHLVETEEIT